jgi:hypothetical protein
MDLDTNDVSVGSGSVLGSYRSLQRDRHRRMGRLQRAKNADATIQLGCEMLDIRVDGDLCISDLSKGAWTCVLLPRTESGWRGR